MDNFWKEEGNLFRDLEEAESVECNMEEETYSISVGGGAFLTILCCP